MVTTLELIFWFCIFLIFYTYFGYPLLLKLISLVRSNTVKKSQILPPVTFIITAHNEEATIINKIENSLSLEYPKDKLQIIVASDASDDATDKYVFEYKNKGVELVRTNERKGKEHAQKHAVERAQGDILIFSDVATILKTDAIVNIVSNFHDPSIGCVSSVDKFINRDGKLSGEGAYVKYEMFLRNLETKANTLVGLSGSFFAARKEVCNNWPANLQSDFNVLLNSIKLGLRGVCDTKSIGFYHDLLDDKKEFQRKIRTILRGICVFMANIHLINPIKYGFFSVQLISHKLFRWLMPFLILIILFINIGLSLTSTFFLTLLVIQILFYSFALVGFLGQPNLRLFKIPFYFITVNLSILHAWIKYISGQRLVMWEPSER